MMVMLVTPVIFVLVDENSDWPNALTLMVEVAVGVLIAIIVYVYSKTQYNTSQELSSRMNHILQELERGHMSERRLVSRALVLRLHSVFRILERVLQQDAKYTISSIEERENILTRQQQRTKDIVSQLDLRISPLKLARIFDDSIARLYSDILIQLQFIQEPFLDIEDYDDRRVDNIKYWKECIIHCKRLLDYVKPHDTA